MNSNSRNPPDEPTPISSKPLRKGQTILYDSSRPATAYLIYGGELIELDEAV
jgi:hypothetical protein